MLTFAVLVFWRAHRDVGANWSPSLEIGAGHRLVTDGASSAVRLPMCASALAGAIIAQALLLQKWIAGLAGLPAFLAFQLMRVPAEEQMMIDRFGEAHRAYAPRTGRSCRAPRAVPARTVMMHGRR
jgi:protein-S-isoprenylcysteine O-methyltransferase Ste14